MSAFFAMMGRMKHIKRWGLMRNTQSENIQEHTAQCAAIAHALALLGNRRLGKAWDAQHIAVLALYHEAAEVITGDLATPIKYFDPEIKSAYKRIEGLAANHLLHLLPEDLQEDFAPLILPEPGSGEARLVKAADKLCAYLKCLEELKAGNSEFERAAASTRDAILALDCPEAELFLDIFGPSFSLTLDEITLPDPG
nr:5'-deoxynucleotidase [bacterium]